MCIYIYIYIYIHIVWIYILTWQRQNANSGIMDLYHLERRYMEVSMNGGTPIAGWFTKENSIKMDDLEVSPF